MFVGDYGHNRALRYPLTPAPKPVVTVTGKRAFATKQERQGLGPIARVSVKIGAKTFKASGTTNWSYVAKLKRGKNVLTFTAVGTNGKVSAPVKVTITLK